jgi:hypothetical protein
MFTNAKHMPQYGQIGGQPWSASVCFAPVTLVIDLNTKGAGP